MQYKLWVFVGISHNIRVLTITDRKKSFQTKPVSCSNQDIYQILFKSLNEILQQIKDMKVVFYSNNDVFSYEWEKEYKIDKSIDKNHSEEWGKIINILKKNNLELEIVGTDSPRNKSIVRW